MALSQESVIQHIGAILPQTDEFVTDSDDVIETKTVSYDCDWNNYIIEFNKQPWDSHPTLLPSNVPPVVASCSLTEETSEECTFSMTKRNKV